MRCKIINREKIQPETYALVPIRQEDQYKIMKWRNEHVLLRQNGKLTKKAL
jgi:hypothetical protein